MHAQGMYVKKEIFMDHLLYARGCATTSGDMKCARPGLSFQGTLIPIRSMWRCTGELSEILPPHSSCTDVDLKNFPLKTYLAGS